MPLDYLTQTVFHYGEFFFFFFNDTATTEIYTLSLHDALPIFAFAASVPWLVWRAEQGVSNVFSLRNALSPSYLSHRSEEHTSELQSLAYLVCRLLLEKKKRSNCVQQPAILLSRTISILLTSFI